MSLLAFDSYGKARIRLLKLIRRPDRHDVMDLVVGIRCEGEFESAFVEGDNSRVVPTDTMKNIVYALAREQAFEEIEDFGLLVGGHVLESYPQVGRVKVELSEAPWTRVRIGERPHRDTFVGGSGERRTARITASRESRLIEAGIENLQVLKTARSGFAGFPRDRHTTLKDTSDRLLATAISATWLYVDEAPFSGCWQNVRQLLLEVFAQHDSRSVQHTLYAMGGGVLENFDEIMEVRLSLPNRHHLPVDLSPFSLDNPNEIFVATDEPHGVIEATLRRT